jgi:16S rRNA (cytosine967-C5)-methyltransferase
LRPAAPHGKRAGLPPSAGLAARQLAWESVTEVLARRAALDDTLDSRSTAASLAPRDDALARAIATATLRRFGTVRLALGQRLAKGLPSEIRLLALLATGAAQILFLDVPDHAAVDITVRLAGADRRLKPFTGLLNAVLRRLARDRDTILAATDPLGIDTPAWLARRWIAAYGEERARRIAEAHGHEAAIDLTVKADPELWAERLGGIVLPTGSVRLIDRTPIRELPGFDEGAWWVQDAAAALPVRMLAPQPGERVLDFCAAPGGKTAQIAAAGARVTAIDRSEPRLRRLRDNLGRLRLDAETRVANALELEAEPFDAVLLDAPCTATGTLRRHPDAAWTKREEDVAILADLQRRLIDKAATLVRPGGRLVYATCSLEPEEGEAGIEAFLARHADFERAPVEPAALGAPPDSGTPAGELRTMPYGLGGPEFGRGGMDGFFAAKFIRKAH